jgi:hypothetical protein
VEVLRRFLICWSTWLGRVVSVLPGVVGGT